MLLPTEVGISMTTLLLFHYGFCCFALLPELLHRSPFPLAEAVTEAFKIFLHFNQSHGYSDFLLTETGLY